MIDSDAFFNGIVNELPSWLFAVDAPTAGAGSEAEKFRLFTHLVPLLTGLHIGALAALFGIGLLMLMFAPERHRRALGQLGASPLRGFLVGAVLFTLVLAVLGMLIKHGIWPGRNLMITLALYGAGIGLSVCGRMLGERLLPERGQLVHTALGLAALILPLASPWGAVPVLLVAAPLGLGVWLLAGK